MSELRSLGLAKRPVFYPDLGRFFEKLRVGLGWSQSDAARYAEQRGLVVLTRQVLLRLENGATKNPEPDVLRAVAELYGQDYQQLVSEFVARRYGLGPDLSRHEGTKSSALPIGGVVDESAAARIRELEARVQRLEVYESIVKRLRPVLGRALTLVGGQGGEAAAAPSGRRRSD